MYESYFKLKAKPFDSALNPAYLYLSKTHKQALTFLHYGVQARNGIVLMTGGAGSGKTMLIRELLRTLSPDTHIARVSSTLVSGEELLAMINEDFGLDTAGKGKALLLKDLHGHLLRHYEEGRRSVLIIDEAQNLSLDLLEEVRMLSNLETSDAKLLQIVIAGQPELGMVLSYDEMGHVRQRINMACHIHPLTRQESEEYVLHRLEIAGNREALSFQDGAFDALYQLSAGLPRQINTLCDFLLLTAYTEERTDITEDAVRDVAGELGLGKAKQDAAVTLSPASGNGDLTRKRALLQALGIMDRTEKDCASNSSDRERTSSLQGNPLSIRNIGLRLQIMEKELEHRESSEYVTLKQRIESVEEQLKAAQAAPRPPQQAGAQERSEENPPASSRTGKKLVAGERRRGSSDRRKSQASGSTS